jgi:hypothetical protein
MVVVGGDEVAAATEALVEVEVGDAEEDVDRVNVGPPSDGKSSPGWSIYDEFAAYSFCTESNVVEFCLISMKQTTPNTHH